MARSTKNPFAKQPGSKTKQSSLSSAHSAYAIQYKRKCWGVTVARIYTEPIIVLRSTGGSSPRGAPVSMDVYVSRLMSLKSFTVVGPCPASRLPEI